ncbi:MAG: DUF126 domain-containing protein [Planctomycetes bacterium]|nr:DUF126 domain-containing protein [Planctomycetota bacterium]
MGRVLKGRALIAGAAEGTALVCGEPLSFWGGLSAETGRIIDRRHPQCGAVVTGRVFVFPAGKGSSTGSGVLLQSIKAGTAPAAIINRKTDPILALGAIVADELYGRRLPMVVLSEEDFAAIAEGDHLAVEEDGTVRILD